MALQEGNSCASYFTHYSTGIRLYDNSPNSKSSSAYEHIEVRCFLSWPVRPVSDNQVPKCSPLPVRKLLLVNLMFAGCRHMHTTSAFRSTVTVHFFHFFRTSESRVPSDLHHSYLLHFRQICVCLRSFHDLVCKFDRMSNSPGPYSLCIWSCIGTQLMELAH